MNKALNNLFKTGGTCRDVLTMSQRNITNDNNDIIYFVIPNAEFNYAHYHRANHSDKNILLRSIVDNITPENSKVNCVTSNSIINAYNKMPQRFIDVDPINRDLSMLNSGINLSIPSQIDPRYIVVRRENVVPTNIIFHQTVIMNNGATAAPTHNNLMPFINGLDGYVDSDDIDKNNLQKYYVLVRLTNSPYRAITYGSRRNRNNIQEHLISYATYIYYMVIYSSLDVPPNMVDPIDEPPAQPPAQQPEQSPELLALLRIIDPLIASDRPGITRQQPAPREDTNPLSAINLLPVWQNHQYQSPFKDYFISTYVTPFLTIQDIETFRYEFSLNFLNIVHNIILNNNPFYHFLGIHDNTVTPMNFKYIMDYYIEFSIESIINEQTFAVSVEYEEMHRLYNALDWFLKQIAKKYADVDTNSADFIRNIDLMFTNNSPQIQIPPHFQLFPAELQSRGNQQLSVFVDKLESNRWIITRTLPAEATLLFAEQLNQRSFKHYIISTYVTPFLTMQDIETFRSQFLLNFLIILHDIIRNGNRFYYFLGINDNLATSMNFKYMDYYTEFDIKLIPEQYNFRFNENNAGAGIQIIRTIYNQLDLFLERIARKYNEVDKNSADYISNIYKMFTNNSPIIRVPHFIRLRQSGYAPPHPTNQHLANFLAEMQLNEWHITSAPQHQPLDSAGAGIDDLTQRRQPAVNIDDLTQRRQPAVNIDDLTQRRQPAVNIEDLTQPNQQSFKHYIEATYVLPFLTIPDNGTFRYEFSLKFLNIAYDIIRNGNRFYYFLGINDDLATSMNFKYMDYYDEFDIISIPGQYDFKIKEIYSGLQFIQAMYSQINLFLLRIVREYAKVDKNSADFISDIYKMFTNNLPQIRVPYFIRLRPIELLPQHLNNQHLVIFLDELLSNEWFITRTRPSVSADIDDSTQRLRQPAVNIEDFAVPLQPQHQPSDIDDLTQRLRQPSPFIVIDADFNDVCTDKLIYIRSKAQDLQSKINNRDRDIMLMRSARDKYLGNA